MKQPLLMDVNNTVFLRGEKLIIVDRRGLPAQINELVCADYFQVARAIEEMAVQGAGDIAITAAYGLYLAARYWEDAGNPSRSEGRDYLQAAYRRLVETRPTGHHLKTLLDKIMNGLEDEYSLSAWILSRIKQAIEIQNKRSEATGRWAEQLLADGDTILTHCFPGPALLHMLAMAEAGKKKIQVIASETRPYLQGARLTAWSVSELDIPVTLISDNMAAYCMSRAMVSKVFTAADRIAGDGTVANKVGTFQLALAAQYHGVPFYVLGYGGPDRQCQGAEDIPIEVRDPNEVLFCAGVKITGDKVKGFYPAFDLTPAHLLTAIITDRGIFPPSLMEEYWSSRP